jgi:hypothetical protein
MERVRKLGPMKLCISESIRMEKNMERASLCGPMTVLMKAISSKTIFMASENISGKTDVYTKDNGKITKCKAKAHSPGPMEENTLETMFKTESRVSGSSLSRMAEYMKVNGSTENSMEGEPSKRKMSPEKEFGKMVKESNGSMRKNKTVISKSPKNNKTLKLPLKTRKFPSSLPIQLFENEPT